MNIRRNPIVNARGPSYPLFSLSPRYRPEGCTKVGKCGKMWEICGKMWENVGKSQFFMGKYTINDHFLEIPSGKHTKSY